VRKPPDRVFHDAFARDYGIAEEGLDARVGEACDARRNIYVIEADGFAYACGKLPSDDDGAGGGGQLYDQGVLKRC